jgi:hypothetical protein
MDQDTSIRSADDQKRLPPEPSPPSSESPNLLQSGDKTAFFAITICSVLAMCIGLPLSTLIFGLFSIQSRPFGTVGASIGATRMVPKGSPQEWQAEQAVRAYLDDLDANRFDSAFQRTSKDMQLITATDAFKNSIKSWPGLLKQDFYTIVATQGRYAGQDTMTFVFVIHVRGKGN